MSGVSSTAKLSCLVLIPNSLGITASIAFSSTSTNFPRGKVKIDLDQTVNKHVATFYYTNKTVFHQYAKRIWLDP